MYRYELHCHTAKVSACSRLSAREMVDLYLANGYDGIFVTDHFLNGNTTVDKSLPYREAVAQFDIADDYIDHIRLFPNAEGVEILNAGRDKRTNELATVYAEAFGKIVTGGSDLHVPTQPVLSGMAFEERLTSPAHMIGLLRAGKGEILRVDNRYGKDNH